VREQIYRMLESEPASMALVKAHDPSWKDVDKARGMLRDSVAQQFQCFREHSRVVMSEHVRKARDRALRMEVLPLYEHRCALCGLRLRWRELVEAEAAHVVPVEKDGVDDVRNALSLCRTHHWAFDAGLWTVDEGKRVEVVSPEADPEIDVEALIVFRGEGIRTPRQEQWRPHEEALAWHREYVFGREVA
jgi:putative restriction endonuclease